MDNKEIVTRGNTPGTLTHDDLPFLPDENSPAKNPVVLDADALPFLDDLVEEGKLIDSLSELTTEENPVIESPVVKVVFDSENKTCTAEFGGKVILERNERDWFFPERFYVDQKALRAAWKAKFKELLPAEFQTSFSFQGGFSTGGKQGLFKGPLKGPQRTSKHAGGQKKKKRRK